MTPKVLWEVVRNAAASSGIEKLAPHDLRRYAEAGTMPSLFRRTQRGVRLMSPQHGPIRHSPDVLNMPDHLFSHSVTPHGS